MKVQRLFLILFYLFLFSPLYAANGEEKLIDADQFFSVYASALDTAGRGKGFEEYHDLMGKRFSASALFATPLSRSLAETSLGLVDVAPLAMYGGLLADIIQRENFSWRSSVTYGISELAPYIQTFDEEGKPVSDYTPIYKADIHLFNAFTIGSFLKLRFGWQHLQESEQTGDTLIIEPGEHSIAYKIDFLKDKFILKTNLLSYFLDFIFEGQIRDVVLGKSWTIPRLDRFATSLYYSNRGGVHGFGTDIGAAFAFLSGNIDAGFLPGRPVPVYLSAALSASKTVWIIRDRLGIPLSLNLSATLDGVQESDLFLPGGAASFGFFLNVPDETAKIGFRINLTGSFNDPDTLLLMPVTGKVIFLLSLGFYFL